MFFVSSMKWKHKESKTFAERLRESTIIRKYSPGAIPVVAAKAPNCQLPVSDFGVITLNQNDTFSNFAFIIRKRIHLKNDVSLYFLVGNTMPKFSITMGELYSSQADKDGFLYVTFGLESTFG